MPGAFEASALFDHDPLATAEEIQRSGQRVLGWLQAVANSEKPKPVDVHLVREIHFRWFETTFPSDAGRERMRVVLNRKGTAVAPEAVLPAVVEACGNWEWRRNHESPDEDAESVEFAIAEANRLVVRIYDVHPFIDGNTRTTWHLRNYVHMLDGLRPVTDLTDQERYEDAWWDAGPENLDALNESVIHELAHDEAT